MKATYIGEAKELENGKEYQVSQCPIHDNGFVVSGFEKEKIRCGCIISQCFSKDSFINIKE